MENTPLGCIPQGSILRLLFSLIYINDLPDNLTSNPNLLTYDTSLCSTVTDPYATPYQINNDLQNINAWAYQWEMNFSPDLATKHRTLYLAVNQRLLLMCNLFSTIIQYRKPQFKSILGLFRIRD